MKQTIKFILQKLLGFENYLFIFALFIIFTLKRNRKEKDFLFFLGLIPSGGKLLDIGANIGVMTYYFSKRFPESHILSYEPVPVNIKILKKIIRICQLSNVRVEEKALGNYSGQAEIIMPVIHAVKMQGLSYIPSPETPASDCQGDHFSCTIETLDSQIFDDTALPIQALKIDVENHEFQVLEGGMECIKKYMPLIYIELWDNANREKCFRLLEGLQYRAHFVEKNTLQEFNPEQHSTQNFIFIPINRNGL